MSRSPWDPSRAEWNDLLAGEPRFRVDQVWQGLHDHGLAPWDQTNLPKVLRERLADEFGPGLTEVVRSVGDDGATVKWLWRLHDGATVETVLMHYADRSTVCISSQAGCAMGCTFCATGQAGFERHLTVGEIVEQVVRARAEAATTDRRLSNVVYMGMGEPLANYDRLITSLHRLNTDLGLGARHLTVSTVGLVPQMLRFAEEGLQVGLAVSLHSANDVDRSTTIPINDRHPIAEVVAACQLFRERTGRRVSFEWAMIDGVNDRDRDAEELAEVAAAARAHVNLIPLNPTPGYPEIGTPPDRIESFAAMLRRRGVNTTVRANRGTDIDAACGQLRTRISQSDEAGRTVRVGLRPKPRDTTHTGG